MIAPLDWGIGHAARCVPVVRAFLDENAQVLIAACGGGEKLLRENFPELVFLPTQSYDISYSAGGNMAGVMILQVPKIISRIWKEHIWIKNIVKQYKIDVVVSDNRYGLFCTDAKTIFLTHQLQIKAPFRWIESTLYGIVKHFVKKYDRCWVVDNESSLCLGGELSHPQKKLPQNTSYVGILSRFRAWSDSVVKKKENRLLVLLSGPEPNRTLLEKKLINMLGNTEHDIVFVRGCLEGHEVPYEYPNICFYNHLPSQELAMVIMESEYIICRSGYSTLMDLASLGCTASLLLIPTPGQTEQEYLAEYLTKKKLSYSCSENEGDFLSFMQFENRHLPCMAENTALVSEVKKIMHREE